MQTIYDTDKREGLEKLVKDLESVKEEEREELINILDHHFDAEKKPFKPIVNRRENRNMGNNNRRRRNNNGMPPRMIQNKENRGPRSDSRRRRSRNRNNNNNNGRRFSSSGRNQNSDFKNGVTKIERDGNPISQPEIEAH